MIFRRSLMRLFFFSKNYPIIRKNHSQGRNLHSTRVRLEVLEDRYNPAQLFWQDLAPSTGGMPTKVLTGDLNGDGKADFAAATLGSVTVGLGNGLGGFGPSITISLSTTPKDIALGDFNGDGKIDIVAAHESSDSLSLLFGDGMGGFKIGPSLKAGSNPQSIAVGFFEGTADKTLDIVTANYGSDNLTVFLSNGDGSFKAGTNISTGNGSFPNFVTVGDFNSDGRPELLVSNSNVGTVALYLASGIGTFKLSSTTTLGTAAQSIVVGDFNNDTRVDFATANPNGNSVSIALGTDDGRFQNPTAISLGSGLGPQTVGVADLNADGNLDLLTANLFDNCASILLGDGKGDFSQSTISVGAGPRTLAIADFNGDAKPDFVTGNMNESTLSIVSGTGSGTFNSPIPYALGSNALGVVATGDFNNDGLQEIVSANSGGQSVSIFPGMGNGMSMPAINIGVGVNPHGVVVADFNRDGRADIATANFTDNSVSILFGNGDFSFESPLTLTTGTNPKGITAADFNKDNKVDIAVTNSSDGTVSLFVSNGDKSFQAPKILDVGSSPLSLTAADFNNDGNLDLVTANSTGNTVSLLAGNGNNSFKTQVEFPVGLNPNSVAFGYFDGDSILDLVTADSGDNKLSILMGVKGGTFKAPQSLPVGLTPFSVVVADFDGDLRDDIATSETGSNSVSVLVSNGDGKFKVPAGFSVGASPSGLALGDFDNDKKVDLVSANNGNSRLSILLSTGKGSFKAASSFGVGLNPNGIISGDFNKDGKQDLATANFGDNTVTVLISDGGGKYKAGVHYNVGSGPVAISTGDVNNDGILDLLTANNSGTESPANSGKFVYDVSLLMGNADGTFTAKTDLTTGANPSAVVFADFNGDKFADLLVANSGENNLTLYLSNGNGAFQAAKTLPAGGVAPQAVFAADLNGDGKQDIIVAGAGDNRVYSFLGNGDSTFKTATSIEVGSSPFSVSAGDFNRDGKLDLVAANAGGNDVSLLIGNSDGKFKTAQSLFSGAGPWSVTVGDLDGDGNADIAAANATDNTVSFLLGNGDGKFQPVAAHTVGSNPYGVTWGDFDGDKRIDLAVANSNSSNVSVLFNFYDLAGGIGNKVTTISMVEGVESVFQVEGKGSPRPTFSITEGTLPSGLKLDLNTGLITGAPAVGSADKSPYAFTITATNSIGSGSQRFTFDIQKTSGIAAKITSPASTNFTYGTTGSFTVVATGTPAPTFSVTTGTLPAGIALDPITGVLAGKANAGVYSFTIVASNSINPAASQSFTLTVDQAALTITADNKTKVYGAAIPILTTKVTGLVNGDTEARIVGLGASTFATAKSNAGSYKISPAGTNPNYKITLVDGNLDVTKGALTISADKKTKVYGADLPVLTTKVAGLVNGDTEASVNGLGATTTATAKSNVGSYTITPSGTSANYTITLVDSTLTVTKAALTIAAQDKTKVYGAIMPALTTNVAGLVNGDTTASITGLAATTTATAKSAVGNYKITAAGTNSNYDIVLVDGALSVTKAALTIAAENKTKVYGAAVPGLTTIVTGLVNGDKVGDITGLGASTSATAKSTVGDYKINPAGASSNYDIKLVDGTLTVSKAALKITPNNLEKTVNSTITFTGLEFTTSPLVVSTDTVTRVSLTSPGAAQSAPVGKYDIAASNPIGTGLANYDITFNSGTLTVVPINLAPSGANKTVTFDEDHSYKLAEADFGFADVDGDQLKAVKITLLPAKGNLLLNGVGVSLNQEISAADIAALKLVFIPGANANGTEYSSFNFQVRDDGGTVNGGADLDPTANILTFNVSSIPDAPKGTNKDFTVAEDTSYTFTVNDFGFSDPNDSPANAFVSVRIRENGLPSALLLNGNVVANESIISVLDIQAGKLKFVPLKDTNASFYGFVNFYVRDNASINNESLSLGNNLTFAVTPAPDAPQITSALTASVPENTKLAQTVTAIDADANTTIAFSIAGGADAKLFQIDSKTGALGFLVAPNFEAPTDFDKNNTYIVQVRASDGALADTETLIFSVANVNEAPVLTSKVGFAINEGTLPVGTITASDPDAGAKLSFSITGGADAKLFSINAITGALAFVKAPNFDDPQDKDENNKYDVSVTVTDNGGLTDSDPITVTVNNVNVTPQITSALTASVQENTKLAQTVTAIDADANTTIAFSIAGGADAKLFQIDSKTGALGFLVAANFEAPTDFDKNNTYIVQVRASDGALADTETLIFSVANVNEAPVLTSKVGFAINEGTLPVGTITASDPDAGAKLSFSITGGADAKLFSINAITGALAFVKAPNFDDPQDKDENNKYDVSVTVTDNGGLSDSDPITVTVNNVNVTPQITSALTASVQENTKLAQTVTAIDADANTTIAFSIAGGADAKLFQIDSKTGALSFLVAPNFEAPTDFDKNNTYIVQVRASDGALADTKTLILSVANVNEAPVLTSKVSFAINEGTFPVGTITASDPDAGAKVSFSITGGADAKLFTINAITGALAFLKAPSFDDPQDKDENNKYDVSVTVTDNGGLSDSDPVTVTVNNVNVTPQITSALTASVQENTKLAQTVTAIDADANTTIAFSIVGGADAKLFQIDPKTGALSFLVAPNFEGPTDFDKNNTYIVKVRASDGALADTETLIFSVANVNEAPVLTSKASFAINEGTFPVGTITASDPDAGAKVSFSITGGADAKLFTINAITGALAFLKAPNFDDPQDKDENNKYDVSVTVTDNGGLTDSDPLTVTVNNVNVTPQITSALTASVPENTKLAQTVTAIDADANTTITFSIVGGADAKLFQIDSKTGALSFLVAPNFEAPTDFDKNNTYIVKIRASDGALADTETLIFSVANVNEAPVLTSPLALTVNENQTAIGTVVGTDRDAGAKLTYSISGGADAALFAIVPSTGKLSFLNAPNFEAPGDADKNNTYLVEIQVSDGSLAETKSHSIKVVNVNEAPTINLTPFNFTDIEDKTTKLIFQENAFSDPDLGTVLTVTVAANNGISGGQDKIAAVSTAKISVVNLTINTITLKGTILDLNQYFSGGNISYTPRVNFNGDVKLHISAYDNAPISLSAPPVIGKITITPVNDRPTLTSLANMGTARRNQRFEITYAMLVGAANEADVDRNPISFRIQAVTSGTLEKWNGTAWVAVSPGSTLLSAGEKLAWTSTAKGTALNAFTVLAFDGLETSLLPAVQAKISVLA